MCSRKYFFFLKGRKYFFFLSKYIYVSTQFRFAYFLMLVLFLFKKKKFMYSRKYNSVGKDNVLLY